jgi:hypothetical protein
MMSTPFVNATNIQIRLTRPDEPQYKDDRIAISYNKFTDLYDLYYKDGGNCCAHSCKKGRFYHVELTGEQLDTYLDSLFFLVRRDADPFEKIQVEIPCFPALIFNIEDLSKPLLRDSLKSLMPVLVSADKGLLS